MTRISIRTENSIYPIYLIDEIEEAGEVIRKHFKDTKLFIIANENVYKLYGNSIMNSLNKYYTKIHTYIVKDGEKYKSLKEAEKIYNFLIDNNISRKNPILAFGGGVVGDLGGFIASTILRGVPFIQFPTTLLSMVDSSIGGKVAVNIGKGKNMVGTFYQPKMVLMNIDILKTLPPEQFASGMAEIIKHAIIYDKELFEYLEKKTSLEKDKLKKEDLEFIIKKSLIIKGDVVSKDTKEKGLRAILNFGHTIGHAIESFMKYKILHGEGVSIGIYYESILSNYKLKFPSENIKRIEELLKKANLPTKLPKRLTPEQLISHMKYDKKRTDSAIRFSLIKKIGEAVPNIPIKEEDIEIILNS